MDRLDYTHLATLSDAECARARDTVMALRPWWRAQHPSLPFYTLGAVSYIDAIGEAPAYPRLATEHNPLLQHHFAWLYERILVVLTKALGAPVQYAPALALPGFHIFLSAKEFEQAMAPIHYDLQYLLHQWPGEPPDFDHPISFTLAITLPSHGGGLNAWDVSHAERPVHVGESTQDLTEGRPPQRHAYQRGHLALHAGHLLHQIAPATNVQPDDERITVQGHGIRVGECWQLYW